MQPTTSAAARKMTLVDFLGTYAASRLWWTSVGQPTGVELAVNTDESVADEDYCDGQTLVEAIPANTDHLIGTVTQDPDGEYRWDVDSLEGESVSDPNRNTITNLVVWGTEDAETPAAPSHSTTVDQHKGDHAATGLRITELTEVRTDFADHFPGIDWATLSDADRAEYERELAEIHEASVALESLDADDRHAAKEALARMTPCDPWQSARTIRDAIESVADGDECEPPARYEIEATDGTSGSGWSASAAGNTDNVFDTEEEAEEARQSLIACCEDFTEDNTRVTRRPR